MDEVYRGFYRSGMVNWSGTQDDQLLLSKEPDQVSFATTRQELLDELRRMRPDVEPQYGYATLYHYLGYTGVYEYDEPGFCPQSGFDEADLDRLRELVRKYKRVRCTIIMYYPQAKEAIKFDPELHIGPGDYAKYGPRPGVIVPPGAAGRQSPDMCQREYRGFYRRLDHYKGFSSWVGLNDDQRLLDLDQENVIWLSTPEEVFQELKRRHPDVEPQYGYVAVQRHTSPEEYGIILVHDKPFFYPLNRCDEADLERLRQLARKYKRVRYVPAGMHNYADVRNKIIAVPDFYMSDDYVKYSPGRTKKKQSQAVTVSELITASRQLVGELTSATEPIGVMLRLDLKQPQYYEHAVVTFVGRYDLLVALYGTARVHKTAAFKWLTAKWRKAQEGNVEKWGHCPHADRLLQLLNKPLKPVPA